jgi:hypothetical protein
MGAQQILRATLAVVAATGASAAAAPASHERIAVIDLGPGRQAMASAIVDAGFSPVIDDGVDDALAGIAVDRDALDLAAALEAAKRAFGELQCKDATASAIRAVGLASARQAAGLDAPELVRAWTYVLLCADRGNDVDAAIAAATRVRVLGGSPEVPDALIARYPEVDAIAGRDVVEIEIQAEVAGAAIWVDGAAVGTSPARLLVPAGSHVIAAAAGARRGFVTGTVVKSQPVVAIPMADVAGRWAHVAARVASWHGQVPAPAELAWVLGKVHARVALIRHGDVVEAWGRPGLAEPPRRLGGDDGTQTVAEVGRLLALVADRVHGWNDHSPDPDQPLLVESLQDRAHRLGHTDEPTRWWVYATIAGAIAAGAIVIYAHDSASDTQRVELHYP